MKMTKKQLSALQRIVGREQSRHACNKSQEIAGVHPSGERFAVTDGSLVVLFTENPEDIPEAERADAFDRFVQNFLKDSDGWLVANPPTVDDCKKIVREWKKIETIGKPLIPKITITATHGDKGETITSCFDARLYIDLLEAVGPYRNIYLGDSRTARVHYPCLLVYKRNGREDWQEVNWNEPGLLFPCHP